MTISSYLNALGLTGQLKEQLEKSLLDQWSGTILQIAQTLDSEASIEQTRCCVELFLGDTTTEIAIDTITQEVHRRLKLKPAEDAKKLGYDPLRQYLLTRRERCQ